jgi:TM2 domain-containing membrane protein YozV
MTSTNDEYIQCRCRECGQHFECHKFMAGEIMECPHCGRSARIPSPLAKPVPPLPQFKSCPFCGEQILAVAKKCKHCGEFLDEDRPSAPTATSPPQTGRRNKIVAGVLSLVLGGLGLHRFYLGEYWQGLLYIAFCWTFIPSFLGIIEGISFLTMSDKRFQESYGGYPFR